MKATSFLGEDLVDVPEPLTEQPPHDRYCDLVLTGGVASGVVYPWAILELARSYRFRNIGGTSVGAMAATLAAAAEYGRRNGHDAGFEVLRRLPGALAEELPDGRTRMLSLFQPAPAGLRLFKLFVAAAETTNDPSRGWIGRTLRMLWAVLKAYVAPLMTGAAIGAALCVIAKFALPGSIGLLGALPIVLLSAVTGVLIAIYREVRDGIVRNDLGLCRGATSQDKDEVEEPGIVQWLHEGIQLAAGLEVDDLPLTFGDLWNAPPFPGAAPGMSSGAARPKRSINLQLITSNVTHGRPVRLPFDDETRPLYFVPKELEPFFPRRIMQALIDGSAPYAQRSPSDPPTDALGKDVRELPGGGMPIVVAARLSLSFPVLFSAVPLYASDYEMEAGKRELKRCWFSDGGLCSNFPVHLFDSAIPRWPTFGIWLGNRSPFRRNEAVWLPEDAPDGSDLGRDDGWRRFDVDDPGTPTYSGVGRPKSLHMFWGFLVSLLVTAKDWQDRSAMRMPHTRYRVIRLALKSGEGALNIAMPRARILEMADGYGTAAGKSLVEQYAAADGAAPKPAWTRHRLVRLRTLLHGLGQLLRGTTVAKDYSAHTVALRAAIEAEVGLSGDDKLEPRQAEAMLTLLDAICDLEAAFDAERTPLDLKLQPAPELRPQPPL